MAIPEANWLTGFENEVITTFQVIKKRHSRLVGIIASSKCA